MEKRNLLDIFMTDILCPVGIPAGIGYMLAMFFPTKSPDVSLTYWAMFVCMIAFSVASVMLAYENGKREKQLETNINDAILAGNIATNRWRTVSLDFPLEDWPCRAKLNLQGLGGEKIEILILPGDPLWKRVPFLGTFKGMIEFSLAEENGMEISSRPGKYLALRNPE